MQLVKLTENVFNSISVTHRFFFYFFLKFCYIHSDTLHNSPTGKKTCLEIVFFLLFLRFFSPQGDKKKQKTKKQELGFGHTAELSFSGRICGFVCFHRLVTDSKVSLLLWRSPAGNNKTHWADPNL